MLTQIIPILLFVLSLTSSSFAKDTLKVGCVEYPPYFYSESLDSKKKSMVVGQGVDILNEKLGKNYKLNFQFIPLGRAQKALDQGIIDVYSGYGQHVIGKRKLSFSSKAYLLLNPGLCGYSLNSKSIKNMNLKDKYVIFPKGSKKVDSLKNRGIKFIYFDYSSLYLKRSYGMLKKGRADFFIVPSTKSIEIEGFKKASCVALFKSFGVYLSYKENSPLKDKLDPLL